MINLIKLICQLLDIFHVRILYNNHGECTHTIFIHHNVLSFYCFQ